MSDEIAEKYIGIMSGTSIDAIDTVIAEISTSKINVIASHTHKIPTNIKQAIANICQPGENEISRMGQLDHQLGELYANACNTILTQNHLTPSSIYAIGNHGQTIRHMPGTPHPFTIQIGNAALLSELTGITTVSDFRSADIAAGGQGAPLVPMFHSAQFRSRNVKRVILNLGGMANISILDEKTTTAGFDTGPGNILLNLWININKGQEYDQSGKWAAQHDFDQSLLDSMLKDAYFQQPPPKSTGREHFNLHWLENIYNINNYNAGVVQSTLSELTAISIGRAIADYAHASKQVIVCGGGARNTDLMQRLAKHCSSEILSAESIGIDPDFVEATAFAWLAHQRMHHLTGNSPAVTGARHPAILGAVYQPYSRTNKSKIYNP